jgi:hypothetical protein
MCAWRTYLTITGVSMCAACGVPAHEHVITYWVLWQKFHSFALTGFEVISHWLPFLLLSPYFGALADRHAALVARAERGSDVRRHRGRRRLHRGGDAARRQTARRVGCSNVTGALRGRAEIIGACI